MAESAGDTAATDGPDDEYRASDGRVPGRRGRATRQKLLDCTLQLLQDESYRDLKVVDIAREAGTSPATFYQYFPDVTAAIVAISEDMAAAGNESLTTLVREGPWTGADGHKTSEAIAEAFIAFWDEHWPLMRVMELSAAEGDQRFRSTRTRLLNEFTVALSEVVDEMKPAGDDDGVDPMATAGALVSMLAHVAAHRYGFEFYGIRTGELQRSMGYIVYVSVTGKRPPN